MSPGWISACSLLALLCPTYQLSSPDSSSYIGAVVDFTPTYIKGDGPRTIEKNTDEYVELIQRAAERKADIVVFPEDGLTTLFMPGKSEMDSWSTRIPSASENYVPCTQKDSRITEAIERLSCAARKYRIYAVVNIAEKEKDTDKTRYYNTNVVFDREGKIIARYRKANLFVEPQFDTTPVPEVVTFDTDFGVKFGTFICFDILFEEPALNLTRMAGVTDIVYSTAWFSEKPFLTAVQAQFGWSFAENVNFLASGYNRPEKGNTGSGIYFARRAKPFAVMSRAAGNRLLISRVPKIRNDPDSVASAESSNEQTVVGDPERAVDGEISLLSDNFTMYRTLSFDDSIAKTVCHGDLCCDFDVRATNVDPTTKYRVVAFSGVRLYGTEVLAGIRVCALVQCSDDSSIASCGSVLPSNTTFVKLQITARFENPLKNLVMPSVLDSSLMPFYAWKFQDPLHENRTNPLLYLTAPTKNVVAFAIYSRDFVRDSVKDSNSD